MVASEALRNQIAAKWQDSFNRLNRGAAGISGLMEFSKVRDSRSFFLTSWCTFIEALARLGPSLLNIYARGVWGHHRRISVSICVALCVFVQRPS